MLDLLHVLVIIRKVRQLHVTSDNHWCSQLQVSPSSLQEHRLVGEDCCPVLLPAAIAVAVPATVVVVVAVVVAHALRAHPYVYAHDCAHNHIQMEVPQ